MRILITNDDGVYAPGIMALANEFAKEHDVTVVAPDRERSSCGRSMTMDRPLTIRKMNIEGYSNCAVYATSGTPTDCVKLGTYEIMHRKTDLVLSGINIGANMGTDIAYSGTVNAAMEACMLGYPAVAFSQQMLGATMPQREALFDASAKRSAQLIGQLGTEHLRNYIYNINFPACVNDKVAGIKVCPQGISNYGDDYEKRTDPFGRTYYWPCGRLTECDYNKENATDIYWLMQGFITVTPLTWNVTAVQEMDDTKCRIEKLKLHF